MKKEEFKNFVKKNPSLIKYVNSGKMTWQKFYEIYNLYGEESNVWDEYIKESTNEVEKKGNSLSFTEILSFLKNIDLDSLKEGIGNVQRVLDVLQDFSKKDNIDLTKQYRPRPLYKHFED